MGDLNDSLEEGGRPDVAGKEVSVTREQIVPFEAVDEGEKLSTVEHVAVAGAVAGVIGELNTIYWVDV